MSDRVNPFAHIKEDPPIFTTKPRSEKRVEEKTIAQIADENNFPSRQATTRPARAKRRKPRIYRTGRNEQFNAKATAETIDRVYKQADEMKVTLGEWMERAANALDRAGVSN
jgi:hypothetical protein